MDYALFLLSAGVVGYKSHVDAVINNKTKTDIEGRKRGQDRYGANVVTSVRQLESYGNPAAIPQVGSAKIDRAYRGLTVPITTDVVRKQAARKVSTMASRTERRHRGLTTDTLDKTDKTDRYGYKSHKFLVGAIAAPNGVAPQVTAVRNGAAYNHRGDDRWWEGRVARG